MVDMSSYNHEGLIAGCITMCSLCDVIFANIMFKTEYEETECIVGLAVVCREISILEFLFECVYKIRYRQLAVLN